MARDIFCTIRIDIEPGTGDIFLAIGIIECYITPVGIVRYLRCKTSEIIILFDEGIFPRRSETEQFLCLPRIIEEGRDGERLGIWIEENFSAKIIALSHIPVIPPEENVVECIVPNLIDLFFVEKIVGIDCCDVL